MSDFSGDELLCVLCALLVSLVGLATSYRPVFSIPLIGRSIATRLILAITPVAVLGITAVVLCRWADPQVKENGYYILLFMLVSSAWLVWAMVCIALAGISIRRDVIDQNNAAALVTVCAGLLGMGTVFAMANVGSGPTIWTTIGPAVLATCALLALGVLMGALSGGLIEAIAIDRDISSGLRAGGAMFGCALVLGRSVAGNWISCDQTCFDLVRFGWPAICIATTAGFLNRRWQPSAKTPRPDWIARGAIPASALIISGLLVVITTPHGLHPSLW